MADKLRRWSYFDSNISNNLVEQRKILNRKNYELDSRSLALKDFGYTPFLARELDKKRNVESIVLGGKVVGMSNEKFTPLKKNYTPIT